MAKKSSATKTVEVKNYRHDTSRRKNIPPAKIAGEGEIPHIAKAQYAYSPHLSPELRFDVNGRCDRVLAAIDKAIAGQRLTEEESELLRQLAANVSQPWLEWAGKKQEHDRRMLEVDPIALHIHERVSASAIVRTSRRVDVQRSLFADPDLEYHEAIKFYRHDIDWTNRLILGDSLQVMSSLARREDLAGKVQMIYMDPPYGIKFASNFQPKVRDKKVKERPQDLTREPEMVKAYRDTWHLGIHSYLSYLRDRLVVAKELLADSGSIFVQISDENLHTVRAVMDEVFGFKNAVSVITIRKTTSEGRNYLGATADYLIWYARDVDKTTYKPVYLRRSDEADSRYDQAMTETGELRPATDEEATNANTSRWPFVFRVDNITSSRTSGEGDVSEFVFEGVMCDPGSGTFKSNLAGLRRLAASGRLHLSSKGKLNYRRGKADFGVAPAANLWVDISGAVQSRSDPKVYVVQTSTTVIERCILMTTKPGQLVLDPTCGSGTTAYVAEQWGRRWITIDTSRVAIAIARQRLLTAKYDHYKTCESQETDNCNPGTGFVYATLPHIKLGSIAQNANLDPIFAKHQRLLDVSLAAANEALAIMTENSRACFASKLANKAAAEGVRSITGADFRRWLLPGTTENQLRDALNGAFARAKKKITAATKKRFAQRLPKKADEGPSSVPMNGIGWEHWQVPFDTDPDWPEELGNAVTSYRDTWRARMDEVMTCIDDNAEPEELVDKPDIVRNVTRVSGPFTVEGVRPEELSLDENGKPFDPTSVSSDPNENEFGAPQNAAAYLHRMIQHLKLDGITFPNNEHRDFARIDPLFDANPALHAEGVWENGNTDEPCNIAIAFGPQYGPVSAEQVEDLIRASRRYDELIIAGFSFDGAAQEIIQESNNPRLKIHMAHIRPDVSPGMDGLLKDSPKSQLFSVFGQPEIAIRKVGDGDDVEVEVELMGVDIYSPLTGEIKSSKADKVAAWFLDNDYDGRCFCIMQAFFPDQDAWEQIAKSLGSEADAEAFAAYDGTVSLPFKPGAHKRIAVKVIDPRGNEVMAIRSLEGVR